MAHRILALHTQIRTRSFQPVTLVTILFALTMPSLAAAQNGSQQEPCATQKAEVRKLEQWVTYDTARQNATLPINQNKLADANSALKNCQVQHPARQQPSTAGVKSAVETRTASGSLKAPVKKRFEDMTALEVAQNPAAYGFKQGGSMVMAPNAEGTREGLQSSHDEQWTKETSDGKLYILTIHYDNKGKLVDAHWGGF